MAYIGQAPTPLPLTASDIPDLPATKITSGTFPALNGSNLTNISAGKINQVLQTTHTTQIETNSTSFTDAGVDVTITPSATDSKILLMCALSAIHISTTSSGGEALVKFYADDSAIGDEYQVAKSRQNSSFNNEAGGSGHACFLHSPSSTSAIKYSLYIRMNSGTYARFCQNNHGLTFTAMEVLA